jgi:hypothetical protein
MKHPLKNNRPYSTTKDGDVYRNLSVYVISDHDAGKGAGYIEHGRVEWEKKGKIRDDNMEMKQTTQWDVAFDDHGYTYTYMVWELFRSKKAAQEWLTSYEVNFLQHKYLS